MTTYEGKTINFDPCDWKGMIALMARADEFKEPCFGNNAEGERVAISVNKDNITVETFQNNGWVRQNTYWNDCTTEETFSR